MKHQWLVYVVVGLLSVGAGVAIAGLPKSAPAGASIALPTTTTTTTTTTVAPAATTTAPVTTGASATSTTSSTSPATTTTDSSPAEMSERGGLSVVAANGANVAGAAQRIATRLDELGYLDVLALDGSDVAEFTVVYYADGFEPAALRLADDLDLLAEFVAPLDEAPAVVDLPDTVELVAYIGLDRA